MFNSVPDSKNNPIFSSYENVNLNFNENMDEFVKAPNDILLEEEYKKNQKNKADIQPQQYMTKISDVNRTALDNIGKVPDFINEEYGVDDSPYKMPDALQVATPAEIEEWKQMGAMGIGETIAKYDKWKLAPFAGTAKEVGEIAGYSILLNKFNKGEELSEKQLDSLTDFLRDMKELEVRGQTFGGKFANGVMIAIPYMAEFGAGLAATGGGVGFASLAKTLSTIGAKKAARKAVDKALKEAALKSAIPAATKTTLPLSAAKKIYKDALVGTTGAKALANVGAKTAITETVKATPKALATAAGTGFLISPTGFVGKALEKQIATGVYVSDAGEAVFTKPENIAVSFMKAIGEQTFEILTETTGWAFAPITHAFAKPVRKLLPEKFFTGFEKLVSSRFGMKATEALKKYGYDGIVEEMGEEVLNRFLTQTFGINGLESYTIDGLMNNVFYANDPSQWGVEALTFAAIGAGGRGLAGATNKIVDTWRTNKESKEARELANKINEKIYTPEQFYLDQGLIRINGSQSLAEQKLRKIWDSQMIDKGLQDSLLNNMSENEIRDTLKGSIQKDGIRNLDEQNAKVAEFKNTLYEKLLKGGVAKDVALANAELMAINFKNKNEAAQEIFRQQLDKLNVEYNIPAEQREMNNVYSKNPQASLFQEMAELDKAGTAYDMPTILINGAEKSTVNSEGRPIAKTKEAIEHFYNWFGDSLVLDENGNPLVVYHGSVQTFEVFDKDRASAEGNVGAGFYFTDNEDDVDDNYYDGGPDFDSKVERLTEQIQQDEDIDYDEAKERAEAQLRGESKKYPVYLAIKNPVYIGGNKETNLFDALENYMPEINEEDYEDYDEYEEARYQAEDEALQTISYQIDDELGSLLQYDDIEKAKGILFELFGNQYVTFEELRERLNQEYFENWDTGELVANEVARRIAEALGYDGIIDSTVTDKFKNMGIQTGTSHYIAFKPEQIKSVDNRGTFDAQNPNIYYQSIAKDIKNVFNDVILKGDSKKIKDIFNIPSVKIVKDYFGDILDNVNIRKMPDWMKISENQYGGYLFLNNTIYINEEYIESFENSDQHYIRTLFHELGHIKQFKLLIYSVLNQYNPKLSKKDRNLLRRYINAYGISKEDEKSITGGSGEYTEQKLKNNETLASKYAAAYNKYSRASLEVDADNVAFALQSLIGQSNNEYIQDYSSAFLAGEKAAIEGARTKEIAAIKAFEKRNTTNQFGFGRISTSGKVNTNTFYQSARNSYDEEKKNLVADKYKDQVKFYNGEWIHRSLLEKKGINFDKVEIGDYLDYFEEYAREPRPEYNPKFDEVAKEYFGTTTNLNEAGYILNDGSLLDLSGKNMGGMAGRRSLDHREINSAFIETENPDYEDVGFYEFIDNGAIRFMPESNSFLIARMPSEKQFDELKKILDKKNGEVFIELVDEMKNWGRESHSFKKEYEKFSKADKILDDVKTFFNGGKISEFKRYFQPAYHGTPHKFDEFSLDAIGTGEGAQVHGWGLYFAENKEVSEDYRKKLTQAYGGMYHDLYLYKTPDNKQAIIEYKKEPVRTDIDEDGYLDLFYQIKTNGKEKAKKYLEENNYPDYVIEDINNINPDDINIVYADDINGQLYEVDIPESDVLLDEDKELIEQPEKVQRIIEKIYHDASANNNDKLAAAVMQINGKGVYEGLKNYFGSAKEASLFLNKYGIKGITYDGYQDGRCYVIFDDKAVKVLNTFYQSNQEESELIAGYTPAEVLAKSQEIWDSLGDVNNPVNEEEAAKMIARANMLEDAIYASANQAEYNPQQLEDIYLNAYYIMNDQEIPEQIMEEEVKSKRNYADLRDLHNKKKEQAEFEYRGYFDSSEEKDVITIMSNADASTALHELGHWYLKALNEMAKVDEVAQKQLDEVDKWLGRSGDYTVSQQEKFAASFEAYLYQGKAPNKELKGVFENFKQWLQSIKNYAEDVLGRGAEISKEVNEMFDRMFADDEYYNERKQARELLNRVRKSTRKERARNNIVDDRELDEVEKRHKDVSYEILSAATGKSVKYLKTIFETKSENEAQAKKREAIINELDKVEDKITISGGMREEWKEFYSDTGVDYETSESGADYELASQALDTIINKAYRNISKDYESEMSDRAEYFEREISKADKEYKELLNSYKKENRNVALAAIYDWMDSLDTNIKQDYEDRFIYDSRIIERNENLDKFDKAKRQIIARALQVENKYGLPKDEKYKEVVKEIMKNLNFLQAEDKARLTANILDVQGVDMLMGRIDSIMDIAKTMEDVNYRRNLQREIHKELQGTKNQKKGARVVGKYDYRTNKIFEKLREYDKLTPEKANDLRLDMQKLMSAEDNGLGFREKLFNKFLSYKANGMIYADTDLMKEIYDEIVRIKLAGKTAKNEIDLEEKLDQTKEVERLVKIIESKGKEKANVFLKGYITGFSNLESALNALFNKKVAQEYGAEILYAETQADVMQYEIKDKFEKEVAKIYELPQWDWDRQIIKYLGEKFEFDEIRRKYDPETFELIKSKTVKKEMTKMDLILAYMWSMNETLNRRLINMFGEAQLDAMFDELSLQDVKLAELMLRTAQSTYPMANKAYIKKYGLDLPKVNAYFPSKVERGTEIDLFNDYSSKTLNNAFTKTRTTSELVPMEFSNPVQILYNHIDGVAKFVNMVEHLDKANAVLNNKEFLKPVIIEKFGEGAYKTLTQILLNTTYKTQSQVYNGIQKIFDYVSSNWIVANISTRPIVALKQLLSANNYATEMPVGDWAKGFMNSILDYKNSIDYMMKIPYVKARLGASMQNEFLKRYIENSAFARTKKLKDFLAMNVKLGDAGSLIFGGKPYIDYLISQGVSESEAIKQFVLQTNRTQQSSAVSSLSNFQVWASRQPIGSVLTAYRNAQQQYVRKCGDAIVAYANGDIDLKQCAKTVFHYMFLQPYMFNLATSGSLIIWATSGDDEEFWADTKLSLFNLCMDSVGLLSETYNYVLRLLVENENYRPMNTPLWGDIQREIGRIAKEDAELDDFISGFGYIFGNIGLGIPVPAMVNMGSGVKDMITDDFLQGLFRTLGYSEKRAKKMSGKE